MVATPPKVRDPLTMEWSNYRWRSMTADDLPLLTDKAYEQDSVFTAESLLREGRRQRGLDTTPVPSVCLLDPDGDVVRHLVATGRARRHADWACYHSELWTTQLDGREIGIVGCAVGGPYAVLVAEQLAVSGCDLVVSVTSAGRIVPLDSPPYFVLVTEALRDEGTSQHYLSPADWVSLDPSLAEALDGAFDGLAEPVHRGRSWTTDAPYRETATAIEAAHRRGIHAVEMEAASLYAYAEARSRDVVCIAHVTNDMAVDGDDFEKGDDAGTHRILAVVSAVADRLRPLTDDESGPIVEHGSAEPGAGESSASGLAEHWNRAYSERGDDVSWYQDVPTVSLELIDTLGVTVYDPVIDVGGGASHLVDELAARGHTDLTVLDVSATALDTVRDRSGDRTGIELINTDLLTWKPQKQYRLWHDRAVLHFITNDTDRARYRTLLDNVLTQDGVVVIAVFDIDGPEQCSGLPVRRYSLRDLIDFLGPDFEPVAQRHDVHVTPWDTEQSFAWIAARRR